MFTRYAIYYIPPPGAFYEAGADWLGWDIARATARARFDEALVKRPQKYGFHATIKAPFHLHPDQSLQKLKDQFANLCSHHTAPTPLSLSTVALGPFMALAPKYSPPDLNALAAEFVKHLDGFRAPLEEQEFQRKNSGYLNAAQRDNLKTWGYPHVFEEFRFHMTLTGRIKPAQDFAVLKTITARFDPLLRQPIPIDALSLVGQREDGMFQLISRSALKTP